MATTRALGHAPWSASKMAMALRCPRLFHYRYVDKRPEPEVMPEARIGKAVHAALEHALSGMALTEALAKGRDLVVGEIERDEEALDQVIVIGTSAGDSEIEIDLCWCRTVVPTDAVLLYPFFVETKRICSL